MKTHYFNKFALVLCGILSASCSKTNSDTANQQTNPTVEGQTELATSLDQPTTAPNAERRGMMPPPFEMNSYKRDILEICDNGKDDDNDGKSDCEDLKCIANVSCIATTIPTIDDSACTVVDLAKASNYVVKKAKKDEKERIKIKVTENNPKCIHLKGSYNGRVDIQAANDQNIDLILDNIKITTSSNANGTLKLNTANKDKGNHFVVKLVGENIIEGGTDSNSNKVFSCDANLDIIGEGKLTVISKYKTAIEVDDVLHVWHGSLDAKIERSGDVNEKATAIKTTHGYIQSGGSVVINAHDNITNFEARGLKVDGSESAYGAGKGSIIITGGTLTVDSDGKAVSASWSLAEDAKTKETHDDPYPDVTITGGKVSVHTYSSPRESRRMGMPPWMDKEKFKQELLTMDTTFMPPEFKEMADKVKKGEDPFDDMETQNSEDNSISPEGIEAKGHMFITGGEIIALATDDAINIGGTLSVSGGTIYAYSTDNDGIDSNSKIEINGGTIVAFGATEPECGFDADFESNVSYTGGTVVAIGGGNTNPGIVTGTSSFIQFDLIESPRKRPGGPGMHGPGGPGMHGPGMGPGHREKTISKLAGKTIAVTPKDSHSAIAAVKVPEGFTGGGNILVMSEQITKDSDYQIYMNAAIDGNNQWFNDTLLQSKATISGSEPKDAKGGIATKSHMPPGPGMMGGPRDMHNPPDQPAQEEHK